MTIDELYQQLRGNHIHSYYGELEIDGFDDEEYEELYETILDALRPIIRPDFWSWYSKWCISYHRHQERNARTFDFYAPHVSIPVENHSIRMQLVVLKFVIGRRYWSYYRAKGEPATWG